MASSAPASSAASWSASSTPSSSSAASSRSLVWPQPSSPAFASPSSFAWPRSRVYASRRSGRRQSLDQLLRDEVRVAGPAGRDVATVLDDERVGVVVARAALGQLARAALEVLRLGERGADLVL